MSGIKEEVLDAVTEEGIDPETVARLVRTFDGWEKAREYKKTEGKRCSENLAARIALFAEAMNVGHSSTGDQVLKLSVVESRWQDLEDAREERKQVAGACREAVKACEQKIRDLLGEMKSNQLSLFAAQDARDDHADRDEDAA